MKLIIGLCFLAVLRTSCAAPETESVKCELSSPKFNEGEDAIKWPEHNLTASSCYKAARAQAKVEMNAALTYLELAAHFSQDDVNLPGFANLFFESASEEREHAAKLLAYMSMRGDTNADFEGDDAVHLRSYYHKDSPKLGLNSLASIKVDAVQALKDALRIEVYVTKQIDNLVTACDKDYHYADYLTTEYLDEQHKGTRDFAGKLNTLTKMVQGQGKKLAEFLFDKKMLGDE